MYQSHILPLFIAAMARHFPFNDRCFLPHVFSGTSTTNFTLVCGWATIIGGSGLEGFGGNLEVLPFIRQLELLHPSALTVFTMKL